MVQRIVLGNSKPSSSQHQDGKTRKTDVMKKMMKSRSFHLSDFEFSHSSSSVRSLSQPRKAPNYMKPTSSSEAKKELFSLSHRHTQSSSDGKSLPQKGMRNSKATFVSCKEPAKTLSRSSSLNSMRTLTKSNSLKPCKACSKNLTSAVLFEDVNAPERATCSSTLKEYNFPEYLTLHPGGTESEGVSVMKVCPYTYCSLNGHGHAPLPPLKSFMSERRHLLETRKKDTKLEVVIPQRWKVTGCDTKENSDIEQIFFHEKTAYDEAATGNPTISPLAQEIGMNFIFQIYAKEWEGAEEMRKFNTVKEIEKQQDINFAKDENGIAAEEDGVKQVTPGMTHDLLKSQMNFEGDFRNYFTAAATEVDNKGIFHLGEDVEDAEENHPTSCIHEETCTERYSNGEHMEDIELDESYSLCWEEQHFREFSYEDTTDSSICSVEEINSKLESLSESSHDISEMWLDDIFNSNNADIMVEDVRLQEAKEERSICFQAQPHCTNFVLQDTSESIELLIQEKYYPSKDIDSEYDESTLSEEVFQNLANEKDNNRVNEKRLDYEVSCVSMLLDEEIVENSEGHSSSESCKIDESYEDKDESLENEDDDEFNQEHIIHMSKVPEESTTIIIEEQKLSEENKVKGGKLKSTGGEEQHTSKNWQWGTKRKRPVEEEEEMRKINPRKPNFLPLVSEVEPEKVDLKHQMIEERKDADEWMLDFALRQAVTKLAPAGKRKVSLLVEAFEAVMSMPKCEAHIRSDSPFAHARPIQACS